jgi:hypothetical protein
VASTILLSRGMRLRAHKPGELVTVLADNYSAPDGEPAADPSTMTPTLPSSSAMSDERAGENEPIYLTLVLAHTHGSQ